MATFVHAADLHIDSPVEAAPGSTADPGADTRTATRLAVVRLVDLTLRVGADLLIIAGDVFDRRADSTDAGRFFAAQMRRLQAADVAVVAAAGNHDVVCPLATGYPANVRWLPTSAPATYRFPQLALAVHGQGLADPTEPADLSAGYPPPLPGSVNVGVLHTSLDGAASRTFCAPTTAAGLAHRRYDYWALGHVHQRRVVSADPWIVYPGNPQARNSAEAGSKGATVVTTDAGRVTRLDHHELAVLRWERAELDCTDARGTDDTLERVWRGLIDRSGSFPVDGRPILADLVLRGAPMIPSPRQLQEAAADRPDLVVHAAVPATARAAWATPAAGPPGPTNRSTSAPGGGSPPPP